MLRYTLGIEQQSRCSGKDGSVHIFRGRCSGEKLLAVVMAGERVTGEELRTSSQRAEVYAAAPAGPQIAGDPGPVATIKPA